MKIIKNTLYDEFFRVALFLSALLVYVSLIPFDFSDLSIQVAVSKLISFGDVYEGVFLTNDYFTNIFMFVPFGFLWLAYFERKKIHNRYVKLIIFSIFFSFLIEFAQLWLPERYFSIQDIVAQFTGCILGMVLFDILYFFKKSLQIPHLGVFQINIIIPLYLLLYLFILSFYTDATSLVFSSHPTFDLSSLKDWPFFELQGTHSFHFMKSVFVKFLIFAPLGFLSCWIAYSYGKTMGTFFILLNLVLMVSIEVLQAFSTSYTVSTGDILIYLLSISLGELLYVFIAQEVIK